MVRLGHMRTVLMVLFDQVQSLDVTGPLEVFTGANAWRSHHGDGPVYDIRTASLGGGMVRTSSGLRIAPDEDLREFSAPRLPVPDLLIVPGGEGSRRPNPELVGWLRAHGRRDSHPPALPQPLPPHRPPQLTEP